MKEYIIVLNSASDIENFKKDMNSITTLNSLPNRACEAEEIKGTRCIVCKLTEDEAKDLSKNSYIKQVSVKNSRTKLVPMGDFNIGLVAKKKLEMKKRGNRISIFPTIEFVKIPKTQTDTEISAQGLDVMANIQNLPIGTNVDAVIVDGRLDPQHPEMKNKQGLTRVKSVNWLQLAGVPGVSEPLYDPQSLVDNHGQHVAGIMCGLRQGWASNSNIYNVYPYDDNYFNYLNGLKNWHLSKTNGNPTVTNHSYGIITEDFYGDIRYIKSVTINNVKINAPRSVTSANTTSSIQSGRLSSINLTSGGSGYTNAPDVSFSGGGRDTAVAIMGNNSVYSINVTNTGSGYTSPPTIVFSAPPAGGTTAVGTCTISGGKVDRIIMSNRGSGYSSSPSITFSSPPPGGVRATATATIRSNFISRINITNGGNNHSEYLPSIILRGGSPTLDAFWTINENLLQNTVNTGVLVNGLYVIEEKIDVLSSTSFRQTPLGGNYASAPSISFIYQADYGPRAVATVSNGVVTRIRILDPWKGFSSPPTVVLTNGGGFTPSQLRSWGINSVEQVLEVGMENLTDISEGEGSYFVGPNIPQRDPVIDSVIEDLISLGIVVVSAAGNESVKAVNEGETGYQDQIEFTWAAQIKSNPSILDDPSDFSSTQETYYFLQGSSPSAADGVICVGSMSHVSPETKSSYSNYGSRINLYAPGENIISSVHSSVTEVVPYPNNSSKFLSKYSGTSMASPQVAGAIACHAENNRTINQAVASNWLSSNAKNSLSNIIGGKTLYFPNITVNFKI